MSHNDAAGITVHEWTDDTGSHIAVCVGEVDGSSPWVEVASEDVRLLAADLLAAARRADLAVGVSAHASATAAAQVLINANAELRLLEQVAAIGSSSLLLSLEDVVLGGRVAAALGEVPVSTFADAPVSITEVAAAFDGDEAEARLWLDEKAQALAWVRESLTS